MKKIIGLIIIGASAFALWYLNKDELSNSLLVNKKHSHYKLLSSDTINTVKLSDTLLIAESTCRGCEFERATFFDIKDSMDLIKLVRIETTDDNPDNMDGGNIDKDLIMVPVKAGTTAIKLFKFYGEKARDSSHFHTYNIQVNN